MIAIEPFTTELYEEVLPLLQAHWREVALYQDRIQLEVDVAFYLKLQALGSLTCFTVRDEGRLVGYCVFMSAHHPHYASLFVVRNDVIYMDPEYRGMESMRLIRFCERHFKGSVPPRTQMMMTWHAKLSNHFKDLLEHLGYTVNEVLLGKLL